jgi:hypothetical protein
LQEVQQAVDDPEADDGDEADGPLWADGPVAQADQDIMAFLLEGSDSKADDPETQEDQDVRAFLQEARQGNRELWQALERPMADDDGSEWALLHNVTIEYGPPVPPTTVPMGHLKMQTWAGGNAHGAFGGYSILIPVVGGWASHRLKVWTVQYDGSEVFEDTPLDVRHAVIRQAGPDNELSIRFFAPIDQGPYVFQRQAQGVQGLFFFYGLGA